MISPADFKQVLFTVAHVILLNSGGKNTCWSGPTLFCRTVVSSNSIPSQQYEFRRSGMSIAAMEAVLDFSILRCTEHDKFLGV